MGGKNGWRKIQKSWHWRKVFNFKGECRNTWRRKTQTSGGSEKCKGGARENIKITGGKDEKTWRRIDEDEWERESKRGGNKDVLRRKAEDFVGKSKRRKGKETALVADEEPRRGKIEDYATGEVERIGGGKRQETIESRT
jgi:hypothetical protein